MDNTTIDNSAGIPGLVLIGIGTFLQIHPAAFLPETLSGWCMVASYSSAVAYYLVKIYNEYKSK